MSDAQRTMYDATDSCPHGSTYARCMNGECVKLRIQDRVKGVAAWERKSEEDALKKLARGIRRG